MNQPYLHPHSVSCWYTSALYHFNTTQYNKTRLGRVRLALLLISGSTCLCAMERDMVSFCSWLDQLVVVVRVLCALHVVLHQNTNLLCTYPRRVHKIEP
jgi:fumarate reductase subunit C